MGPILLKNSGYAPVKPDLQNGDECVAKNKSISISSLVIKKKPPTKHIERQNVHKTISIQKCSLKKIFSSKK